MTFTPEERAERMARFTKDEIETMLRRAHSKATSKKEWMKRERKQMQDDVAATKEKPGLNDLSEVLDENGNIKPGVLR